MNPLTVPGSSEAGTEGGVQGARRKGSRRNNEVQVR